MSRKAQSGGRSYRVTTAAGNFPVFNLPVSIFSSSIIQNSSLSGKHQG
jgi:hypothetical protein